MKYVVTSDIKYFKTHLLNIFLFYIGLIIFYLCFRLLFHTPFKIDLFYDMFGLNFELKKSGMLEMVMFFFQVFFYLYVMFQLVYKDLKYNTELLFLRLKILHWLFLKIVILLLLYCFILCIPYLILFFITLFSKGNMISIIMLFIKHILFLFFLSLYGILCAVLGARKKEWEWIGILGFGILLILKPICIVKINGMIFFLITVLILGFVFYLFQRNFSMLFESVKGDGL